MTTPGALAAAAPVATPLQRWATPLALVALVLAVGAGLSIGPVRIPLGGVLRELLDHLPFVDIDSGLSKQHAGIVWEFRAPRVVLGMLVGAMLSLAGASYQGVFRNPLADPYLLGAAAGAGLGATAAIVARSDVTGGGIGGWSSPVPIAAFAGSLVAVAMTLVVGGGSFGGLLGGRLRLASPTRLVLAGVAITSFLTAAQTFVQQQNNDVLREVYSWILGRLTTSRWSDVAVVAPYLTVVTIVLLLARRSLDVLAVGDEEAGTLGVHVGHTRLVIVIAASLGTAACVAVSGLIGFVGIIVPHTVRLLVGGSYRRILPLSTIVGAAFLVATDLLARTVQQPAEIPIGVITAFIGAPFFLLVLRTRSSA